MLAKCLLERLFLNPRSPAWRAIFLYDYTVHIAYCFNHSPRVEGDSSKPGALPLSPSCFNPRPRVEGDMSVALTASLASAWFQSAPSRGGR